MSDERQPMSSEEDLHRLRRIQSLTAASFIAGPVSLFFGGVLLSTISLVCAILAFRRIRGFDGDVPEDSQSIIASMRTQSTVALVINIAALGMNLASFALSAATLLGMMDSGQLGQFLQDNGIVASDPSQSDGSIWDRR